MEHSEIKKILSRYTNGIYSKKDIDSLIQSVKDGDCADIESVMNEIWKESAHVKTSLEEEKEYMAEARTLLDVIQKRNTRLQLKHILRYAAIILIFITMGIGSYVYYNSIDHTENTLYSEVKTPNGKRQRIVLPDHSTVTLNVGSTIRYPKDFSKKERLIELTGEAFFEVTPDKNKPFIIRSRDMNITVLGTSFSVKSYDEDEDVSVMVSTGKVKVEMENVTMKLEKNEYFTYNRPSKEYTKRNENPQESLTWMRGGLYFDNTSIQSVVRELERVYDCDIEFEAGSNYNDYIYGGHENQSLESVLKSIEFSTNIKYRKEYNKIILYK